MKKKKEIMYKNEKCIDKIITLAVDSLTSHLPYTHRKTSEGIEFNKKCVKEYTEIIINAIQLW